MDEGPEQSAESAAMVAAKVINWLSLVGCFSIAH